MLDDTARTVSSPRSRAVHWLAGVLACAALLGSGRVAAQRTDVSALERALARRHSHWVHQIYEPDQTPTQRACWNRIASRANALTTILEERRAAVRPGLVADIRRQLATLDRLAGGGCRDERRTEGEVEVEVRAHPFRPRMSRTGVTLRAGYRYELVPRAARLYERTTAHTLDVAVGGFALSWLRLEGSLRLGTVPDFGPHGAVGARALIVAPWGLLRLSGGVGVAMALARDRRGNTSFGWVGSQVELPLEIGFELTEHLGLTLAGGLLWTQPGAAPRDSRTVGGFAGLLLEAAL